MRDHPPAVLLAQAEVSRRRWSGFAAFSSGCRSAAAPGEGDVLAGGDVELDDVERRPAPATRRSRPGVAVGVDAAHALVRRRDVEHHDVVGVVGQHRVQVTGRAPPPPSARSARGSCFVVHVLLLSSDVVRVQPRADSELIARPRSGSAGRSARSRPRGTTPPPRPTRRGPTARRAPFGTYAPVVVPHVRARTPAAVGARRQEPPPPVSGPSTRNPRIAARPAYHWGNGGIEYRASSASIATIASTSPASQRRRTAGRLARSRASARRRVGCRQLARPRGPAAGRCSPPRRRSRAGRPISAAEKPSTSRSSSTARCRGGRRCSATTNASSTLSHATTRSAGSSCSVYAIRSSGKAPATHLLRAAVTSVGSSRVGRGAEERQAPVGGDLVEPGPHGPLPVLGPVGPPARPGQASPARRPRRRASDPSIR